MQGYIYKLTLLQDTEHFKVGEIYIGKANGKDKYYFSGGETVKKLYKKYSKSIFKREIIQENIEDEKLLNWLEIYWVSYYNCNRNRSEIGLNLTDGGDGGTGKKHNTNAKHNMSLSKKGKRAYDNRRPIIRIDKQTLEQREYESIKQAAKENNIIFTSIGNCLQKLTKSAGGYLWKDKN